MAWLNSIFGGSTAANLIAITVGLVLVLLGLFWLFRKIAGDNKIRGTKSRRPRLGVTEAAIVDDKRRLVLVRRDNVEHLVLIGGASDVLVERNIVLVQSAKGAAEPVRETAPLLEVQTPDQPNTAEVQNEQPKATSAGIVAGGAVAGASVMSNIESALASTDDEVEDTLDSSEFTAAVADSLAEDANVATDEVIETTLELASDTIAPSEEIFKAAETVEAEVEAISETALPAEDVAAAIADPTELELPDIEITELEPEPDEVELNVEIEEIPEVDADLTPELVEAQAEEVLADPKPEQVQPMEAAIPPLEEVVTEVEAAPAEIAPEISDDILQETPQQEATLQETVDVEPESPVSNESRHDDMEDEMQKLLSELAGTKSS